jgi:hypothetical protein
MNALLKETREHWQAIGPLLTIRDERDYAAAIERLDTLLKEIGADERRVFRRTDFPNRPAGRRSQPRSG